MDTAKNCNLCGHLIILVCDLIIQNYVANIIDTEIVESQLVFLQEKKASLKTSKSQPNEAMTHRSRPLTKVFIAQTQKLIELFEEEAVQLKEVEAHLSKTGREL